MSKQSSGKNPKIHRQKTFDLTLTKHELLHVRDLMSLMLPPNGEKTVSQALAEVEERNLIESFLWEKVTKLCVSANLPLNNEAPDYIVAPIGPPPMGIFHVNHDMEQQTASGTNNFLPDDQSGEDDAGEDESDESDE